MTETTPPANPVKFVCTCVTILAMACALIGGFLLWKGYAGGEVLASQIGTAIGGLLGVLSQNRAATTTTTPAPTEPATPQTTT